MLYQYFVDIVPTEVKTFLSQLGTYQYSVKDHERPIDHHKGSHGIPGIFFKYDVSALKVQVTQERDSPIQFVVRLCATIAGICVISGECDEIKYFLPSEWPWHTKHAAICSTPALYSGGPLKWQGSMTTSFCTLLNSLYVSSSVIWMYVNWAVTIFIK